MRVAFQITSLMIVVGLIFTSIMQANATSDPNQILAINNIKIENAKVITAGQPTPAEFQYLSQAGTEVVINLIPNNSPNYQTPEPAWVKKMGMEYINIGVDASNPTFESAQQFITLMEQHQQQSIFIHCVSNYRASAFYYLYQISQGIDQQTAQRLSPWGKANKPPQWQALIEQIKQHYLQ